MHSRKIAIIIVCEVVILELLIARAFVNGAVSVFSISSFLFFLIKITAGNVNKLKYLMSAQMTLGQMEKTMETMRSICGPKHKLTDELIDGSYASLPHRESLTRKFHFTLRI